MPNPIRLVSGALILAVTLTTPGLAAQDKPLRSKPVPADAVKSDTKVNINDADFDAVYAMVVDAKVASAIIAAKPYRSVADLKKIFAPAIVKKIEQKIQFTDSMLDGGRGLGGGESEQASDADHKVNLNTATFDAIVALKDVDAAMARRIIDARARKPFSSKADLQKRAGIPGDILKKIEQKIEFTDSMLDGGRGFGGGESEQASDADYKVNLNSATFDQIVALQNVDAAMAKRIISARKEKPFSDALDLKRRAKVPGDVLKKIEQKIEFTDSMLDGGGRGLGGESEEASDADYTVDVNNADQTDIAKLPEVGDVLARRVVRSRPYGDAADLAKVVPDWVLWKLMPKITISQKPAWPIDVSLNDDGSGLDIVLHCNSGGYEFRVDQVAQNGPIATVHCTVTVPGRNEATTDDTPDLTVRVDRKRLGARTNAVKVMVSTEERGVSYLVKPRYELVTTLSIPNGR